ncbi:hypothetical protein N2152v2_002777 [Parachlorella kessleri]
MSGQPMVDTGAPATPQRRPLWRSLRRFARHGHQTGAPQPAWKRPTPIIKQWTRRVALQSGVLAGAGSHAAGGAKLQGRVPTASELGHVPSHWEEHLANVRPGERRALDKYIRQLEQMKALGPGLEVLTDDELKSQTAGFRERLRQGETLDGLLPEAFAVVREAAWRVLRMRHFDVQLLGGMALHDGRVAEMKTGEGKTLVGTLPAYLHALKGEGVHIVTVNEYLAQRDAEWIGKVFTFLGLTVGVLSGGELPAAQKAAAACDITYVTAPDLAFAFLRDNTATHPDSIVLRRPFSFAIVDEVLRRPFSFAIVDEVDSILIDECRNPFIINSNPTLSSHPSQRWETALGIVRDWKQRLEFRTLGQEDVPPAPKTMAVLRPEYKKAQLMQAGMWDAVWQLVWRQQVVVARGQQGQLLAVLLDKGPPGATKVRLVVRNPALGSEAVHSGQGVGDSARSSRPCAQSAGGGAPSTLSAPSAPGGGSASLGGFPLGVAAAGPTAPPGVLWADSEDPADVDAALLSAGLTRVEKPTCREVADVVPTVLWEGEEGWGRFITTAAQAQYLYLENVDYNVRDAKVVIVDRDTGRERERSRWQAGIHPALEVKHGLKPGPESVHQASITFQCLFKYYPKLAGMTGTAATEEQELQDGTAATEEQELQDVYGLAVSCLGTATTEEQELQDVYGLTVIRVPPHKPNVRVDSRLECYAFRKGRLLTPGPRGCRVQGKVWRLTQLVQSAIGADRPVLICTRSVQESEEILGDLRKMQDAGILRPRGPLAQAGRRGLVIQLLNAKPEWVRKESRIIAQAGEPRTVTIATAMAGRGTDILLGGNAKGHMQMLLENKMLEVMAGDAPDFDDSVSEVPLKNLEWTFMSEESMEQGLPPPVWQAYSAAKRALAVFERKDSAARAAAWLCAALEQTEMDMAHLLAEAEKLRQDFPAYSLWSAFELAVEAWERREREKLAQWAQQEDKKAQQGQAGSTGGGSSSNGRLGGNGASGSVGGGGGSLGHGTAGDNGDVIYGAVGSGAASNASSSSSSSSSRDPRAVFSGAVISGGGGGSSSVSNMTSGGGSNGNGSQQGLDASKAPDMPAVRDAAEAARVGEEGARLLLRRYILLQWFWFEERCAFRRQMVRDQGGLRVILASPPYSKRTELQMRGRAGRQGDPGDTFLLMDWKDPCIPQQSRDILNALAGNPDEDEEEALQHHVYGTTMPQATVEKILQGFIGGVESSEREARSTTQRFDEVLDGFRRSAYTLRRILLCGSPAQRSRLMLQYLVAFADHMVDSLADGSTKPATWRLLDLCKGTRFLINGDQEPAFKPGGPPYKWEWVGGLGEGLQVRMDLIPPETTAGALLPALEGGGALPHVPLMNQWHHTLPPLSLRDMVAMRAAVEAPAPAEGRSVRGAYAAQAARLRAWLRAALVASYLNRKALLEACYMEAGAVDPLWAASVVRLWEKSLLLARLDALWADFLQDVSQLQTSANLRAFSLLDPLDEFRLHSGEAFAQLLTDFRQGVVLKSFAPLDLFQLEILSGRELLLDLQPEQQAQLQLLAKQAEQADRAEHAGSQQAATARRPEQAQQAGQGEQAAAVTQQGSLLREAEQAQQAKHGGAIPEGLELISEMTIGGPPPPLNTPAQQQEAAAGTPAQSAAAGQQKPPAPATADRAAETARSPFLAAAASAEDRKWVVGKAKALLPKIAEKATQAERAAAAAREQATVAASSSLIAAAAAEAAQAGRDSRDSSSSGSGRSSSEPGSGLHSMGGWVGNGASTPEPAPHTQQAQHSSSHPAALAPSLPPAAPGRQMTRADWEPFIQQEAEKAAEAKALELMAPFFAEIFTSLGPHSADDLPQQQSVPQRAQQDAQQGRDSPAGMGSGPKS